MCNLYTVRKSVQEVAAHFGVKVPTDLPNISDEIYPGSPGLVAREQDGNLVLQSMTWGRPHRPRGMKETSKPIAVNNIAEIDGFFWKKLAEDPKNRCLAPVGEFAEAEGPKGAKTRTWVTIEGREIAEWGALCGPSDAWGNWYSGMMTNANDDMAWLHKRMPVFILPDERERFLHGSLEDLLFFQNRVFPAGLLKFRKTPELWVRRKSADVANNDPNSTTTAEGRLKGGDPRDSAQVAGYLVTREPKALAGKKRATGS